MPHQSLEERVRVLEQQVARLFSAGSQMNPVRDWREAVGMFSGNEAMKAIDAAGRAIREADRRRARTRPARRRSGKAC
jgi:hypothetical protein